MKLLLIALCLTIGLAEKINYWIETANTMWANNTNGTITTFTVTTYGEEREKDVSTSEIISDQESSIKSKNRGNSRAKFVATITTSRPLVDGEYFAWFCVSVSDTNQIKHGEKGVASGVRKGAANGPTTTMAKQIITTIDNTKVKAWGYNGWDLSKAFVEASGSTYTFTLYSKDDYNDIGVDKTWSGKMKCYCQEITTVKELLNVETKIGDWYTHEGVWIRTNKLTGASWTFTTGVIAFGLLSYIL